MHQQPLTYEENRFKCFGCEVQGDVYDLIIHEEGGNYIEAIKFAESISLAGNRTSTQRTSSSKEYLSTRHLSVEEARSFNLGVVADPLPGHESYKNRLAIPYITPSGVVDIRFRTMNNHDDPKYMGIPGAKTTMFNAQVVLTAGSYICVTEGELDTVVLSVKTGSPISWYTWS
jgi:hypothetical protein